MKNKIRIRFSKDEDKKLIALVNIYGENWKEISRLMCSRNEAQCKERWKNYLNPNIDKSAWTEEKDNLLLEKQKEYGNVWVFIAKKYFPGKTGVDLKNRYQSLMAKKRKIEKLSDNKHKLEADINKEDYFLKFDENEDNFFDQEFNDNYLEL